MCINPGLSSVSASALVSESIGRPVMKIKDDLMEYTMVRQGVAGVVSCMITITAGLWEWVLRVSGFFLDGRTNHLTGCGIGVRRINRRARAGAHPIPATWSAAIGQLLGTYPPRDSFSFAPHSSGLLRRTQLIRGVYVRWNIYMECKISLVDQNLSVIFNV
jgi:hypothetical protein